MTKFPIYTRRDGFQNSEYLNNIGKQIYDIFKILHDGHNQYFHRVNSIEITSLERDRDNVTSPHYKNKAVDFIIDPIEYMPYYYGVIHACYPFNLYLGGNALHIHADIDYSEHENRKGIEYKIKGEKKVIAGTGQNIDYFLQLYNFGFLTRIQDFGLFEDQTRKLYLTYYKITEKLPISYFLNTKLPEKSNLWIYAFLILGGVYFLGKHKGDKKHGQLF